MHAGLVPIVSRESGVDVTPETGILLERSSIDEIRARVVELSRRSPAELEATSLRAWRWVRAHHTRDRFAAAYREALLELIHRLRPELRRALAAAGRAPSG
jgi:hypothetical protein